MLYSLIVLKTRNNIIQVNNPDCGDLGDCGIFDMQKVSTIGPRDLFQNNFIMIYIMGRLTAVPLVMIQTILMRA